MRSVQWHDGITHTGIHPAHEGYKIHDIVM